MPHGVRFTVYSLAVVAGWALSQFPPCPMEAARQQQLAFAAKSQAQLAFMETDAARSSVRADD